ncbi:TPA: helix-turn-helix domain-containing protein [Vibrio parahaemolyticus]|uniref:helix-turn-helix transcriptional regulator n=1 Tax=Vibrio TaxID=662 RepID=UPI0004A25057|nr:MULTISPECIES: helix-turn-helix domain-containing protein [Vibrio]EHZ2536567.1 helix-turn-helix domain-containing protein [Vibrio parahaemolyticus]MBE4054815.1 helix-turn-helix domain-containing protein [Vibrio parahaemolyticus]MDW1966784.1 helix-turn-helix domain-containing protein [Vibrio sp. Vb0587]TOH54009.1 AlpA family phage regulatory protein [Vibrio parahaemolyticus]UJX29831.1 helix-turn-helix domain-containing protein [Vibrio parahaemolyticus]
MAHHLEQSHQIDRIIPMEEVAQILGRSPKTIWRWYAKEKIIPMPLKLRGRAVGYRSSTLEAFLNSLEGGQ